MKIEVRTPSLKKHRMEIYNCSSLYHAHTVQIYRDAHGYQSEIYVNGKCQSDIGKNIKHPNSYNNTKASD